jgi:hypothetical protein
MKTQSMTRTQLLESGIIKIVPGDGKKVSNAHQTEHFAYGVTKKQVWSDAPMFWQKNITPVCQMTPKELDAELARQARRMKSHEAECHITYHMGQNDKRWSGWDQVNFLKREVMPSASVDEETRP